MKCPRCGQPTSFWQRDVVSGLCYGCLQADPQAAGLSPAQAQGWRARREAERAAALQQEEVAAALAGPDARPGRAGVGFLVIVFRLLAALAAILTLVNVMDAIEAASAAAELASEAPRPGPIAMPQRAARAALHTALHAVWTALFQGVVWITLLLAAAQLLKLFLLIERNTWVAAALVSRAATGPKGAAELPGHS
jgi:hypothetical protein